MTQSMGCLPSLRGEFVNYVIQSQILMSTTHAPTQYIMSSKDASPASLAHKGHAQMTDVRLLWKAMPRDIGSC